MSGLSPANIVRLKQVWEKEYAVWRQRDLSGKRYAYVWVDGIYFNVRLQPDRPCVLVVVGATHDGRKELLAVVDGERESSLSWRHLLEDLKARGLTEGPCIAVGDRALGFWKALREAYPRTREQQCWVVNAKVANTEPPPVMQLVIVDPVEQREDAEADAPLTRLQAHQDR